jgi:hypothetical protein
LCRLFLAGRVEHSPMTPIVTMHHGGAVVAL